MEVICIPSTFPAILLPTKKVLPTRLQGSANQLGIHLCAERLGPLNWGTNSAVNDELRKDTKSARYTEEDRVVVLLSESVVLEEDTGVGINVGVWVLGLAVLSKDTRGDLVDLADKLEHGVVGQMLLSEFALRDVAGISLAEHSVAVTGNNLTSLEGGPEVVLDVLIAEVVADSLLHLLEPDEDFLVSPVSS